MSFNSEESESTPLLRGHRVSVQTTRGLACRRKMVQVGKLARKHISNACCNSEVWKTRFPITKWILKYRVNDLTSDFIAGLTVAMTVIPQGLAYSTLAGLPPQYGLYSAFMGCFIYTFLGTSKDITLGPTAIMSLMTATFAMSPIKGDATYAIVLCLMTGVVQLAMGLLNLGILVNFISHPVINAFTSAAAIRIAFGQVKGILGLKNIPRDFLDMVYETFKHIPKTNVWDLTMGLSSLVLLILMKKLRVIQWKDDPGTTPSRCVKVARYILWLVGTSANAIVVISASGIVAILLSYDVDKLTITGHIKSGLPPVKVPAFSVSDGNTTISTSEIFTGIGAGFIIVPLLGLVELIAIAKAFSRRNNYKIYPSQELIAIGIANIVSSFFSSYPVTGSFSRTAVNSQSGVRTPASGIVTGAIILLALQVLTPLFKYIPKSALAAVIISAVIQMVDYEIPRTLWRVKKLDLIPLVITFISSLAVGIEYGIIIGVGISLIMLLYPMARPKIKTVPTDANNILVLKINHGLNFPAVDFILEEMERLSEKDGRYQSVVLDCSHISEIDFSSIQCMKEMIVEFARRDSKIVFACITEKVFRYIEYAEINDLVVSATIKDGCRILQDELKKELQNGELSHTLGEATVIVDISSHL
ncbi:sodium-independent sulfate anion transporter-like isoform X2 [Mytilus edulis]|uniref:sodium-independent sulfate anion transporter-like isoform X2 n=1 Tax=Mytilus edulis TaxID=6550 RepID=UPI0039EE5BC2